jgi:hypothetical protein
MVTWPTLCTADHQGTAPPKMNTHITWWRGQHTHGRGAAQASHTASQGNRTHTRTSLNSSSSAVSVLALGAGGTHSDRAPLLPQSTTRTGAAHARTPKVLRGARQFKGRQGVGGGQPQPLPDRCHQVLYVNQGATSACSQEPLQQRATTERSPETMFKSSQAWRGKGGGEGREGREGVGPQRRRACGHTHTWPTAAMPTAAMANAHTIHSSWARHQHERLVQQRATQAVEDHTRTHTHTATARTLVDWRRQTLADPREASRGEPAAPKPHHRRRHGGRSPHAGHNNQSHENAGEKTRGGIVTPCWAHATPPFPPPGTILKITARCCGRENCLASHSKHPGGWGPPLQEPWGT